MAARTRKVQHDDEGGFYVYRIFGKAGETLYVGKGSSARLQAQKRRFGAEGEIVARFKREADAYAFEVRLIAEMSPALNKHPGGNGPRCKKRRPHRPAWLIEMERIGSRVYAAREMLARWPYLFDPSTLEKIRQVAYG